MSAAIEVVCALAAISWICFVAIVAVIGYRVTAKLRARRRRIYRLFAVMGVPVGQKSSRLPWRRRPRRRPGIAELYRRSLAALHGFEPDRVIIRFVDTLATTRIPQPRNGWR